MPSLPGCTDPRSPCFANRSHGEGRISPGMSSVPEPSGHSRAVKGPQNLLKVFKGNPRASLQVSTSPALSADWCGTAGRKTLQLESPPSPLPEKMPCLG